MLTWLLTTSVLTLSAGATQSPWLLARHERPTPTVQIWTNRDDVVYRGERVKVYVHTDYDAYLTVFRVDTDGRVRILFPHEPWEDNYLRGRRDYEVRTPGYGYSFAANDYPGEGYLFAVAATDPFDYRSVVSRDHWDYRLIGDQGFVSGDPYIAFTELIERITPRGYGGYSWDVMPYYVERKYEYPRFLCYECHSYVPYPRWDPYVHSCIRFRIVIYDDPYYYPARIHPGSRVVFRRPADPGPRFVFKNRRPEDRYVTRTRTPRTGERRRPGADRNGITRRDLGDERRVPIPGVGRSPVRRPSPPNDGGVRRPPRRKSPLLGPDRRTPARPKAVRPNQDGRRKPTLERRGPRSQDRSATRGARTPPKRRASDPGSRRPAARQQPPRRGASPQPRKAPSRKPKRKAPQRKKNG